MSYYILIIPYKEGKDDLFLDFLYFDGTYNAHRTMLSLYQKYEQSDNLSLGHNFLAEFANPGLTTDYIHWSWMA